MGNTFGQLFRVTTFGESHGGGIGVVVDGCPPRIALSSAEIQRELDRRRPGQSRITTQRNEPDRCEIVAKINRSKVKTAEVEATIVRCPDKTAAKNMIDLIEQTRAAGDSLGGVIECVARNVPAGLGEPVFDKLEADLAKAMLSLPATKGFEVGSGFSATRMCGSEHNDAFEKRGRHIGTGTNFSGGIQGGISNGEDIYFRVAFKPAATIAREQDTITSSGKKTKLAARGRHDPCVLPRAVPMVEAMTALVLCDHALRQKAIAKS